MASNDTFIFSSIVVPNDTPVDGEESEGESLGSKDSYSAASTADSQKQDEEAVSGISESSNHSKNSENSYVTDQSSSSEQEEEEEEENDEYDEDDDQELTPTEKAQQDGASFEPLWKRLRSGARQTKRDQKKLPLGHEINVGVTINDVKFTQYW